MGGRSKIFLASVAVVLALVVSGTGSAAASTAPCNGHPTLCSRTLDRVVLPGSHNSMSAEELGWNLPNQTWAIPGQLQRGARAFLIDTYYGRVNTSDGKVENLGKAEGSETGADLYLCHASCRGGASSLVEVFGQIAAFLRENPREVLVFINEDNVTASDFAKVVEESGLIEHVYEGPTGPWPTLGEMISTGGRVLFLAQSDATGVPWYHRAYDGPMRETPYSFSDLMIDRLTTAAGQVVSCQENRGGNTGGLFLMNHWVLGNNVAPVIDFAVRVNRRDVLVSRARTCEKVRGKLPTILAVDFFGTGDVVGAALTLNGLAPTVTPRPPRRLTAAQIRKKARALCKRKKGRARKVCLKKQTARLKRKNARIRTLPA